MSSFPAPPSFPSALESRRSRRAGCSSGADVMEMDSGEGEKRIGGCSPPWSWWETPVKHPLSHYGQHPNTSHVLRGELSSSIVQSPICWETGCWETGCWLLGDRLLDLSPSLLIPRALRSPLKNQDLKPLWAPPANILMQALALLKAVLLSA